METAIVVAVTVYRFDPDFLLDLDIFSFDRLMEISRRARNEQIVEEAIAIRNAMNADKKEFEAFLKHYAPAPSQADQQELIADSKAKLRRILGG